MEEKLLELKIQRVSEPVGYIYFARSGYSLVRHSRQLQTVPVRSCSLEHPANSAVIGKNHTEEINFTLPTVPTSPLPLRSPSTPSPSYRSNLEEHTPIPIRFPKRRSPPGKRCQLTRESTESMLIEGPSRPSPVTVTTSTASIPSTSTLPSSGIDLNGVPDSSERLYKRVSSPRKYQNRPHIYADVVCRSFLCYSA